jgi:hypothetical protein
MMSWWRPGYAKLLHGPENFATILHALAVPAPHLMAWLTICHESIDRFVSSSQCKRNLNARDCRVGKIPAAGLPDVLEVGSNDQIAAAREFLAHCDSPCSRWSPMQPKHGESASLLSDNLADFETGGI